MIRNLLLPKAGGGSLRRFLRVRRRLLLDQWNDSRPLRGPVPLLDLRDRDDAADLRSSLDPNGGRSWPFRGWRTSDDGVIGGYSSSRMEFVEDGDGDGIDDGGQLSSSSSRAKSTPFLRWSGTLSTRINSQSHLARNVTRSGFAAILSPDHPFAVPLGNKYRALEVCCRTDGRTYAVNLHVETYFPEDVYQGFIVGGGGGGVRGLDDPDSNDDEDGTEVDVDDGFSSRTSSRGSENYDAYAAEVDENDDERRSGLSPGSSPPDVRRHLLHREGSSTLDVRRYLKDRRDAIRRTTISSDDHPYRGHPPIGFQRFVLPFRDFVLTSRGRVRHHQRGLDGAIGIESIGFTLMDGVDGDFRFDLVSLRAVNVLQGEVVGSMEDERREEEFRDGLLRSPMKEGKEAKEDDGLVKAENIGR